MASDRHRPLPGFVAIVGPDPAHPVGGMAFVLPGYVAAFARGGWQVRVLPTWDPRRRIGSWWPWLGSLAALVEVCVSRRRQRAVVVSIHVAKGVSRLRKAAAAILARSLGARVIMHFHCPTLPEQIAHRASRWLVRACILAADRLCVLAPFYAVDLAACGDARRIRVVPNPLPPSIEAVARAGGTRAVPSSGPIRLLTMTRLVAGKGVDAVVAAMAHLPRNYVLRVAGDGPQRAVIDRMIAELALADRVEMLGWVGETQKEALFAETDAFVLPSRLDSFGMVYCEAMARAIPVVALAFGPIPQLFPEGGAVTLAASDEPRDLARTIVAALGDAATATARGERGRRWLLKAYAADVVGRRLGRMLAPVVR